MNENREENAFLRSWEAIEKKDWEASEKAADAYFETAYRPNNGIMCYAYGRFVPTAINDSAGKSEGVKLLPTCYGIDNMYGFVKADPDSQMTMENYKKIKYWIRNGLYRDDGDEGLYLAFLEAMYDKRVEDIKNDCLRALEQLPQSASEDKCKTLKEEEAEKLIALYLDILKFQISINQDFIADQGESCLLHAADTICELADKMVEDKMNLSSMLSTLIEIRKFCGDEDKGDYSPDSVEATIENVKKSMSGGK